MRGWKDILWRVYSQMNEDHLLTVAAGVVYYCLLALFPALAAFVSLYGLVADASTIDANLSSLSGFLPGGGIQILHDALQRLTAKGSTGLSLSFAVGIVVALWSANSGVKAIIDALNAVYGENEKRGIRPAEPRVARLHPRGHRLVGRRARGGGGGADRARARRARRRLGRADRNTCAGRSSSS